MVITICGKNACGLSISGINCVLGPRKRDVTEIGARQNLEGLSCYSMQRPGLFIQLLQSSVGIDDVHSLIALVNLIPCVATVALP